MERVTPLFGASTALRRCARPGCADVASATLAFRYDQSQAWLTPLVADKSPATYDLCGPCADRTKPPRGWELVDERPDLDAQASPASDHDAVREAIAAALRGPGGTASTPPASAAPMRSVPLAAVAEVADPTPGAPAAPVDAPAPSPRPAQIAPAARQATPIAARTPRDVLAVRHDRPRPVEVLISAPTPGVSGVPAPPSSPAVAPARSQAPVQHSLEAVASAVTAALAASDASASAAAAPMRLTAVEQPLAFDDLPDRLVPMGEESAVREA